MAQHLIKKLNEKLIDENSVQVDSELKQQMYR